MLLSTRRRIISGVLVSGEPVLPRGWTVEIAPATSHVRDRQLSQSLALNTHCSTSFGGVPALRCAVRILGDSRFPLSAFPNRCGRSRFHPSFPEGRPLSDDSAFMMQDFATLKGFKTFVWQILDIYCN